MKSDSRTAGRGTAFLAAFIATATFIVLVFGALTFEAIATMIAWGWFVPSTFGIRPLSLQEAIGLVALVNFALLPIAIPLNSMQVVMSRYVKARATADLVAAVRGFIDLDKKNKEMD